MESSRGRRKHCPQPFRRLRAAICARGRAAVRPAPMVAAGMAMPLVGGPRPSAPGRSRSASPLGVPRATATLAETRRWAAGQSGVVGARIDRLLDDLARARHGRAASRCPAAAHGHRQCHARQLLRWRPAFRPGRGHRPWPRLADAGADILDIGGESTRPGARPWPRDEEAARVCRCCKGCRIWRRSRS